MTHAHRAATETVPVIDLSGEPARVEDAVARACADWGFFHLMGHGLDARLIDRTLAQTRAFFAALAMETHERLSFAYFCNPAFPAVIRPLASTLVAGSPARYRDLSWAEFRRRADSDFADYGAEVQISDYRAG